MERIDLMVRNIAIGLAIMILLPITVAVGVDVFNPKPEQSQFALPSSESLKDGEPVIDQEAYGKALTTHRKIFFYTSDLLGLLFIAVGSFIQIPFIGLGFILGGSISLIVGYASYWNMLNKIMQLISLLIALALLAFSAYWQSRKKQS